MSEPKTDWTPDYSPWRHGGWYVNNVRYLSGAVGCVSRNYADRKWRIVDENARHFERTYSSRDAAARAELTLAATDKEQWVRIAHEVAEALEAHLPSGHVVGEEERSIIAKTLAGSAPRILPT